MSKTIYTKAEIEALLSKVLKTELPTFAQLEQSGNMIRTTFDAFEVSDQLNKKCKVMNYYEISIHDSPWYGDVGLQIQWFQALTNTVGLPMVSNSSCNATKIATAFLKFSGIDTAITAEDLSNMDMMYELSEHGVMISKGACMNFSTIKEVEEELNKHKLKSITQNSKTFDCC